jgi:tetratricopeptide (TPR) repeat protein
VHTARHCSQKTTPPGVLLLVLPVVLLTFAGRISAEETAALRLIRSVEALRAQYGRYAPETLPPLIELGKLYGAGQCEYAIDILDLALEVSRRAEGVLSSRQLEIYQPLIHCHVTLDWPAELRNAQQYVLLINESLYGRNDPRMLPVLEQAARRYEDVGLYLSARKLHRRALDITRDATGRNDLTLVPFLRGMARAFRLEYAFGLAAPDLADVRYETSNVRSGAFLGPRDIQLDRLGERSLARAVAILRSHPEASRNDRIETLLELGDWYQLAGNHDKALRAYREAWQEIDASGGADSDLLRTATPLLFRLRTGTSLRRPPRGRTDYRRYTVDMDYAVTTNGSVRDVTVLESNAPRRVQQDAVDDLRYIRHRPGFIAGEPVESIGLHYRQNIYVGATEDTP